jgi:group I intron endonuclease
MNEKKHNLIYKITNKVNGNIYIGQHMTDDMDDGYMGSGKAIKAAIKKHGIENFIREILHDYDTFDKMNAKEEELVDEDFVERRDNYNQKTGGSNGSPGKEARAKIGAAHKGMKRPPRTEEHKAKLSAAKMGNTDALGRKHTPEARAKMSAVKKGTTRSPETRARMSAAHKGKTHTPEHKANVSKAKRGKKQSPESIAKRQAVKKANNSDAKGWATRRANAERKAKQVPVKDHVTLFYRHRQNVTPEPIFGADVVAAVMAHEIVTLGPIIG